MAAAPGSSNLQWGCGQTIPVIGPQFCAPYPIDLTVTEKAVSITDGDYAVTDINGSILFKVKGVFFSLRDRRTLLDASGNPIITMQQKILSAHRRWQGYRGDSTDAKHLLFSAKKSSILQFKTEVDVFLANNNTNEHIPDFKIKGSFFERSCTIYHGQSDIIVAQVEIPSRLIDMEDGATSGHHFRPDVRLDTISVQTYVWTGFEELVATAKKKLQPPRAGIS